MKKYRCFYPNNILSISDKKTIDQELEIDILRKNIQNIKYGNLNASLEDIENTIEQVAISLRDGLVDKIKRGVIHYSEECELDNLAHLTRDGGCH